MSFYDYKKKTYGIIFDAGSTGSRIHVFTFRNNEEGSKQPYELLDEYFEEVKPGLSAYADDPKKAAASLENMLMKAKEIIPYTSWNQSVMSLKATAGLRLLSGDKAKNILNEVETLFRRYPFKMNSNAVSIMDGDEEGTLSHPSQMYGVMDLGGGSTQITFVPQEESTKTSAPKAHLQKLNVFGNTYSLYTHSYLGLGLMSARYQIMGGVEEANAVVPSQLSSVCVHSSHSPVFEYRQTKISIKGVDPQKTRYEDCLSAAAAVIQAKGVFQNTEIQQKPFITISYYYDRAVLAGLIGRDATGATLKVQDYENAAKRACEDANQEPFMCLDLTYITALLNQGFKFSMSTTLTLHKQIDGKEISWALGAMFKLMNSKQQTTPGSS